MSAFHNDVFNRRGSSAFLNEFRQDNHSGIFAPPAMPKPMFSQEPSPARRSSFSVAANERSSHQHFAYVAGCEICEEYVRCGTQICVHEHRIVCHGIQHGCCCCHCCDARSVQKSSSENTRCATPSNNGYSARTEESMTDSKFGPGRVRTRSSTTTVGDAGFGFANMDAEMLRMAKDNRWRNSNYDSFYGRPLNDCAPPPPPGHIPLRENNVQQAFAAQHQMHGGRQEVMLRDAADHFAGNNRPMPLFGKYERYRDEEEDTKVTTTTTTTTKTTRREIPCEEEKVVYHKPTPPIPPPPPPQHHHHHHEEKHHHEEHHHHGAVIPIGTRPDVPIKAPEPCCTWCRILPCFSCPHPQNPNARFHKVNFRLYPEYEFLPDDLEVPKSTDYFPDHTQVPSRNSFKVTIPKVTQVAQRVYVDFIGDQMVVIGEHGRPHGLRRMKSDPSTIRSSTRSSALHHGHSVHPAQGSKIAIARVFAKNFFVPRDTYDRDRAQAFIKPNGKLKILVPVLDQR
ncbi:hypothetical protein COEREDRAFT_82787 [Coemansia reversa NRRL 1564]|uniref:SHSP domain-containing protein n=1 Tax=Coemansia reversa (strain ATCC 12441 / NRRL 1564) TaxID=763665 RepID=A0A2G5B5V8_COERN|nr:hypothetical protein COEREDRAFT_82787 [Coemansia reversa NRRL 1564]|eukprot:PIA14381.1 hypothetical protein COEREDRAFT_82787 [Coemansia reversa NRRL 1564]